MKNKNYSEKQAIHRKNIFCESQMFNIQNKDFNYLKNVQN